MIWDGDAGRSGLGLALECCRDVGCDWGRVQLLVCGNGSRRPWVCEVRGWIAQVLVVAHAIELGLLTGIDCHCHLGDGAEVVEERLKKRATVRAPSRQDPTSGTGRPRVEKRGERRSQAHSCGICEAFELESDTWGRAWCSLPRGVMMDRPVCRSVGSCEAV